MSTGTRCANCDLPASERHGLPVNDRVEFVPVGDTSQEWGGVPACEHCHAIHAAAGPLCNEVLKAYAEAVQALGAQLTTAREELRSLYLAARNALEIAGEP